MGKMKDKFMDQQEKLISDAVDAFADDDYQYQEYLNSLAARMGYSNKPVTMEDKITEHDAWWDSLTDEEKQKLYEESEAAEKERIERELDGELFDSWDGFDKTE